MVESCFSGGLVYMYLFRLYVGAVIACICCFYSLGQEIAVLMGQSGHNSDFDTGFDKLGWKATYFPCTKDGMSDFTSSIDKFDFVIVCPLFNSQEIRLNPGDTDSARIREYIEDGGMLVITDGSYISVREWLKEIDPDLWVNEPGNCTSSQWVANGYAKDEEPLQPIRMFPNRLVERDSWPHIGSMPAKTKWTVAARCSEGFPVCLTQEIGKGIVVFSSLRQRDSRILENYYSNSLLRKSGLQLEDFEMSEHGLGRGTIRMKFKENPKERSIIVYEITDSNGKTQKFSDQVIGKSCEIGYAVTLRGPVTATLSLLTSSGSKPLFIRKKILPPLFEVQPNAYRGIISTERRVDSVDFKVELNPALEDLRGARIKLEVFNSQSNKVADAIAYVSRDKVPGHMWIPIKLPHTLPAGSYAVRGALNKGRGTVLSETSFRIFEPTKSQTIIDGDNTLLVQGKPFFPLGIYHVAGKYKEVSDIGFNFCQFWRWMLGGNTPDGEPQGLAGARTNGLMCLFESNHKFVGLQQESVARLGSNPAISMWYVGDEPTEGDDLMLRTTNDEWHKYDEQHPTYLLLCRPDLFGDLHPYGDILAFNAGGGKTLEEMAKKAVENIEKARAATDGHKALIYVPWSIPDNFETVRILAYTAIVSDIRGIIWYCWDQTGGGPVGIGLSKNPEYQAKFKDLLAEIKSFMPGLLSTHRRTFKSDSIHGIVFPSGRNDERFAVMINISEKSALSNFKIPEISAVSFVTDVKSGKRVSYFNGRISQTFEPFEVKILRW